MKYPFSQNGKEVLKDGSHYADAVDDTAGKRIAFCLNVIWRESRDRESLHRRAPESAERRLQRCEIALGLNTSYERRYAADLS